jgi:hypothetical protein
LRIHRTTLYKARAACKMVCATAKKNCNRELRQTREKEFPISVRVFGVVRG